MTLWGPLIAAIVFSVLAETLRLQVPQVYMMSLGLLLILSVLYLPGGLASVRADTFRGWRDSFEGSGGPTSSDRPERRDEAPRSSARKNLRERRNDF